MRAVVIFGLGLVLTLLTVPAAAGTVADYNATSSQFQIENGVRVYRVLSVGPQTFQNQIEVRASEQAFERGYIEGFETALNTRPRKVTKSLKRSQTGRSRRNYGRRYSTSGSNPRYSRFRSNISYGRPAYIAFGNRN